MKSHRQDSLPAVGRPARAVLIAMLLLAASSVASAAAPEPPTSPSAVVAGRRVTVTWLAPVSGSVPLGYIVEAALSPGGATVAAFLVIQPSIVVDAVPDGVYYIRIRSGNAEGISPPSTEVMVAVPGATGPCPEPPHAPTNLNAAVSGTTVTLTWQPAPTGCPASGYVVQAGSAPGLSDLAVFNVGNTTVLSVPAQPGFYYVRVIAVNASGGSAPSSERTVNVLPGIDLTGVWSGTSDYINAPFTMHLTQRGTGFGGTYLDQKDFGGVAGRLMDGEVVIDVNFGDGGFRMFGTVVSPNRIRGTLIVPLLGGRIFSFEMTR